MIDHHIPWILSLMKTLCVLRLIFIVFALTDVTFFFFFVEATKKNVENYTTFTVTGTVLD